MEDIHNSGIIKCKALKKLMGKNRRGKKEEEEDGALEKILNSENLWEGIGINKGRLCTSISSLQLTFTR